MYPKYPSDLYWIKAKELHEVQLAGSDERIVIGSRILSRLWCLTLRDPSTRHASLGAYSKALICENEIKAHFIKKPFPILYLYSDIVLRRLVSSGPLLSLAVDRDVLHIIPVYSHTCTSYSIDQE